MHETIPQDFVLYIRT